MASIVVTGDTSGAITIAAPAVAGTNTLTLPASTGTLVVTGGAQTIEFADGSAAAPSITNSGDTNTGMFFPAADTIAFSEGGTESMRIDSSGHVIVGHTASVGTAYQTNMQLKGSSASNYAGYGLITSNNESAGLYGVYSNGENSLWIASDPDNLRAGSRIVFSVDTVDQVSIASGGNFAFNSGYGSVATAYGCRAWVNFNGSGTPAIRASGNVSSITDNGTGAYVVNFTTAMPNTNYAGFASASTDGSFDAVAGFGDNAFNTTSIAVTTRNFSAARIDPTSVFVSIFR